MMPNIRLMAWLYMVGTCGGFLKQGYPPIIQFNGIFPQKDHPAIGVPPWPWKAPCCYRCSATTEPLEPRLRMMNSDVWLDPMDQPPGTTQCWWTSKNSRKPQRCRAAFRMTGWLSWLKTTHLKITMKSLHNQPTIVKYKIQSFVITMINQIRSRLIIVIMISSND